MTSKKRKSKSNAAERFLDKISDKLPKNKFLNVVLSLLVIFLVWVYCLVATLLMATGLLVMVSHIGYVIFTGAEFQIDAVIWGIGIFVVGLILARIFSKDIYDVVQGSLLWGFPSGI